MRWWLKACPKCRGDVYRVSGNSDDLGCLQCGRTLSDAETAMILGKYSGNLPVADKTLVAA
ncbi:MAG: hypothetical protein HW403_679 [Dehalococcoidia bacterium]|nr:hypothetical protein [Dehalococcoidia bacterium]